MVGNPKPQTFLSSIDIYVGVRSCSPQVLVTTRILGLLIAPSERPLKDSYCKEGSPQPPPKKGSHQNIPGASRRLCKALKVLKETPAFPHEIPAVWSTWGVSPN